MSIRGRVIFRRLHPLRFLKTSLTKFKAQKKQVNFLLERALEEENAALVDVGGVQGVVN